MKRHGRSGTGQGRLPPRWYVLFATVLGFIGLMIAQGAPQVSGSIEPVRSAANDRLSGGGQGTIGRLLTRQDAKAAKINALEAEVRELSRYKSAAISMAERLEAYEDILNLVGEPPARGVTARVAAENDGPFAETLLANAGRSQGVEAGAIAVNEGGLVGRVVQLGERSCRILLVTDFNSRVPVLGEISGVRAIMYGGRDGLGRLTDLPERHEFVPGERILTSGEGGAFPRGLVVGEAAMSGENWRVEFSMAQRNGGFVQLVPPPTIPKPVPIEDIEPADPDAEPIGASPTQGARQ